MRYLYSVGGASRKCYTVGKANRKSLINNSVMLKRTKAVNETPSRLCQVTLPGTRSGRSPLCSKRPHNHGEKRGSQHEWLDTKPHVRWMRVCDQIAGRVIKQVSPREEFVGRKGYGQWYMHTDGRTSRIVADPGSSGVGIADEGE